PIRTSGRSTLSCMRMTLAMRPVRSLNISGSLPLARMAATAASVAAFSAASFSALSCGFSTLYLTIFLAILMDIELSLRASRVSVAAEVPLLQADKQVCGGVHLAVVLDFLVTARLDDRAIL